MVSITSYVMVAYMKGDRMSNEARSSTSSSAPPPRRDALRPVAAVRHDGTTSLPHPRAPGHGRGRPEPPHRLRRLLLVFAGFGFKTAAVPFHFWCPERLPGRATPVTAFLSVAPKRRLRDHDRFFYGSLATRGTGPGPDGSIDWPRIHGARSALTMTVGNVAALTQTNMKRLLAYSSIAHAGYIMMGVVALSENGARGMMIYLLAYLVHEPRRLPGRHPRPQPGPDVSTCATTGPLPPGPFLTAAMAVFLLSAMGHPAPRLGCFMGRVLRVRRHPSSAGPSSTGTRWWRRERGGGGLLLRGVLKTMIIDAGNEDRRAFSLPAVDQLAVMVLVAANVLPLLWSEPGRGLGPQVAGPVHALEARGARKRAPSEPPPGYFFRV
jgi:hypothetical protein